MRNLKYPPAFIQRFSEYLASKEFSDIPSKSKSSYWKHFASVLQTRVEGDNIVTSGSSGYYVPPEKSLTKKIKRIFYLLTHDFNKFKEIAAHKLGLVKSPIRMLSYGKAFDAVMNHEPIACVVATPYTVNFKKLKEHPEVIQSLQDMKARFYGRDQFNINDHIIIAYYYWNILNGYLDLSQVKQVLEIGAGNGNFCALFYYHLKNIKVFIVDLPETLCASISYIVHLFPQAKIWMPNEGVSAMADADFVFLTPKQIDLIKDNSIDLAINTHSFQEMEPEQIEDYFKLIQRVCSRRAAFFTSNRVEKTPIAPGQEETNPDIRINRFSEYPWDVRNKDLVYEVSRFSTLVQTEPVQLRLQQIVK